MQQDLKITYSLQSSQFLYLLSAHGQPTLKIQASVNYCRICDDPVNFQSLVSWVERQSRLVELKDAPLSRQYTSRSAFPCVLTPISQGVLNLLCGILQRTLFRSLGTRNGLQPLPPTVDVQSASANSQKKLQFKPQIQHTLQDTANAPPHMLLVNPEHAVKTQVTYSRKHHQSSRNSTYFGNHLECLLLSPLYTL